MFQRLFFEFKTINFEFETGVCEIEMKSKKFFFFDIQRIFLVIQRHFFEASDTIIADFCPEFNPPFR